MTRRYDAVMVEDAPQQGLCPVCGHWLPMSADQVELGQHGRCRHTGKPSVRARLSGSDPASQLGLAEQPASPPPEVVASREAAEKRKSNATSRTVYQDFLDRVNSPVTRVEAARFYEDRSLAWLQQEQRLFILSGAMRTAGTREPSWLSALDEALALARTERPREAPQPARSLRSRGERLPIEESDGIQGARAELARLKERRGELIQDVAKVRTKAEARRVQRAVARVGEDIHRAQAHLDVLLYGPPKGRTKPGPSMVRSVVSGGLPTLGRGR